MLHHLNGIKLLLISLIIAAYFIALYLSYIYKLELEYSIIGVFRELLTIPFLLAQIFFLVVGAMMLWKRTDLKYNYMVIFSIIILLTSAIFTFGSILK